MPFSPENSRDLALSAGELADCAVHEQLSTFADVRKWRLKLMRHMPQKSVSLLRQVEQTQAQPLQLPAQALQVARPGDADGAEKRAAAQLVDGPIDLPERATQGPA